MRFGLLEIGIRETSVMIVKFVALKATKFKI